MMESLELLDGQTVAVVDVETTGLYAFYGDRVCEVGIVRALGDEILDTYQTLVNPQRRISAGASRVNGLSDFDVAQAPLFAEIAEAVLERIDGVVLVAHNAPFDLSFLEAELKRLGRDWQPAAVIDTLEIARRFHHSGSNSLASLSARLGIPTPQAHRALGDALTTFQVMRSFYHQLNGEDQWAVINLPESEPSVRLLGMEALLPLELQEALQDNQPVGITYIDREGTETCRVVTPLRVREAHGYVYLVAFCHLRQAERSFRLDRIVRIEDEG